MAHDLFADELLACAAAEQAATIAHAVNLKTAAIARKQSRIETRRAKSEAALADVLPSPLEPGVSYHVISTGDVDALSYLMHIAKQHRRLDDAIISTWCLALPEVDYLAAQQQAGRIGFLRFYCGEILRNTYPDTYDAICALEQAGRASLTISRNHAKVTLCRAGTARYTVESSANMNTNPRIEQTALHSDPELYRFYDEFFSALKCIDRKSRQAGA